MHYALEEFSPIFPAQHLTGHLVFMHIQRPILAPLERRVDVPVPVRRGGGGERAVFRVWVGVRVHSSARFIRCVFCACAIVGAYSRHNVFAGFSSAGFPPVFQKAHRRDRKLQPNHEKWVA